jgi:ABC-type glycerol-3-phosphate transport system permease component
MRSVIGSEKEETMSISRAWGELMGGALLGSVPLVMLFAFLMDYSIGGLIRGMIK